MWNKDSFDTLTNALPLDIHVAWDKKPSAEKYGHVSTLLTILAALHQEGASFADVQHGQVTSLHISPIRRRLTDHRKRIFTIVGHETGAPLLYAEVDRLVLEIYFNYHCFVEADTTYRQYFPSATVIVRCSNFLTGGYVRSPGSWGSDAAFMTSDWEGTLIVENAIAKVPNALRRHFRGFKLAPTPYKFLVTGSPPNTREYAFIANNGFIALFPSPDVDDLINDTKNITCAFLNDK
jgi:hypothetical protein